MTPIHNRFIQGKPDREGLEIVGVNGQVIRNLTICGGSTCLRLIDCDDLDIKGLILSYPTGPTGPDSADGHALQLIRCTGVIRNVAILFNRLADSEDGVNIFGRSKTRQGGIWLDNIDIHGRGKSDSGCHFTFDEGCPPVKLSNFKSIGARCGITIAGGAGHQIMAPGHIHYSIDADIYVADLYKSDRFGRSTIDRAVKLERGIIPAGQTAIEVVG